MQKKNIKKISIGIGILFLLFLIGNFGLNIWLKYKLPDFLKENTDYIISYKNLKVDLGNGNIFATQFKIDNKNPDNENIIRIKGTIDSLQVSRFGIWKLLLHKEITSNNIQLNHPNLAVTLARPAKKVKRRNTPLEFANINIRNGNIRVNKFNHALFFSAQNLDLHIENLELTEASMEKEFPIAFDSYSMSGKNFLVQPDDVYRISAANINTENKKIDITDFKLTPQISYGEFLHRFPTKRNLFKVNAKVMRFHNISLTKKNLTLSEVSFTQPDITLYTTQNKTEQKKKSFSFNVQLENLLVDQAKIQILKPDSTRLFAAQKLNMKVSQMRMDDETAKGNIPFAYQDFKIEGQQLNYISDRENVEVLTANLSDKSADLQHIRIKPTVPQSHETLMDLGINQVNLLVNSWGLQNNKLQLDIQSVLVNQVWGSVHKGAPKTVKTKTDYSKIQFPLKIHNIQVRNADIAMLNHDSSTLFAGKNINLKAGGIVMNENTIKNALPLSVPRFHLTGQHLVLGAGKEKISILAAAVNQKSGDFRQIKVSGKGTGATDFSASKVDFMLNKWGFTGHKLNLDVQNINVDGIKGKIIASAKEKKKKKPDYSGIAFPLKIHQVNIRNSNLTYSKSGQPLVLKNLNASFGNVVMDANSVKSGIPFRTGTYNLSSSDFQYQTKFYNLSIAKINVNQDEMDLLNFSMKPRYSRSQFVRKISFEQDLYTLSAASISMKGKWNLISSNPYINASSLIIDNANANIFRSKIPKDNPKVKPLYSEALRKIKFPLYIAVTKINNSYLEYEEDTPKSDGPGKLTFNNLNLTARNINSAKMKGKPTAIPISISCSFFNVSPMQVNWNMNTANHNDAFTISGTVGSLPASRVNAFVEPYLKIRTTGTIQKMDFDFHGNKHGLDGTFKMKHKNLKVSILKGSGEKNKLLSAVANVFVRSTSDKYPESVVVDDVERDPAKSFFNLFWKGIEEGLKKTLIGKNVENTEKSVKNTVEAAKETTQSVKGAVKDANSAVKDVKNAVTDVTSGNSGKKKTPKKDKKEGLLKRVFKKKEKTE